MLYACVVCGCVSPTRRCALHGGKNQRATAWQRGYQAEFNRNRAALLAREPLCACGAPATVADHDPPRRQLIAMGVTDPDAERWLTPMCRTCHRQKTAQGR